MGRSYNSQVKETSVNSQNRTNKTSTNNVCTTNDCINIHDCFKSSVNKEVDKKTNRLLAMKMHKKFSDTFTGIGWFKGTFKLQVREGSHSYEVLLRGLAYALQE